VAVPPLPGFSQVLSDSSCRWSLRGDDGNSILVWVALVASCA
jgi:hypothetical protein